MKGMELFCSSPASTAVISSMDKRFQFRRSPKSYGHDRRKGQPRVPCSSHFPINPKPYCDMQHRKKKTSASSSDKQNDNDVRRKSCVEVSELYNSHPTSSSRRYLLRDDVVPIVDWVSQSDQIPEIPKNKENSPPAPSKDQVVVLRVSLHCKGCEGKVRKHISKMIGVTSYSIDLETKKVTIIGDVTPLGVLASVSKVKKAQLWSSSSSSTPSFLWTTI